MVGLYVHAATHAVGQALGLLEDFLQHEVRVAALLYLSQVQVYFLHFQVLLHAADADHLEFLVQPYHGYVIVLQVDHLVGVLHDGRSVGA